MVGRGAGRRGLSSQLTQIEASLSRTPHTARAAYAVYFRCPSYHGLLAAARHWATERLKGMN